MLLKDIVDKLKLTVLIEGDHLEDDILTGYAGDLLSDVIASGKKGDIWITIQAHENIIAVATLKDLSCIILAKQSKPFDDTLKNAKEEGVTLLTTPLTTYEIVEQLSRLGISGTR